MFAFTADAAALAPVVISAPEVAPAPKPFAPSGRITPAESRRLETLASRWHRLRSAIAEGRVTGPASDRALEIACDLEDEMAARLDRHRLDHFQGRRFAIVATGRDELPVRILALA